VLAEIANCLSKADPARGNGRELSAHPAVIAVAVFLFPSNPSILKDSRERSTVAVRERIRSALTNRAR